MNKILSLAALFTAILTSTASAVLTVGEKAPDFSLKSFSGENISLSSLQGQIVVLEWFNHNCPFVHKFYKVGKMQQWQADAAAKGVIWLTIDSTNPAHQDYLSPEQAALVYEQMHIASRALLLDAEGNVGRLYGAVTTPHIYVIGKDGTLLYQGGLDDKRSSDSADIAKARNYLLEAVEAAVNGKPIDSSWQSTRPYGCSIKYAQ